MCGKKSFEAFCGSRGSLTNCLKGSHLRWLGQKTTSLKMEKIYGCELNQISVARSSSLLASIAARGYISHC